MGSWSRSTEPADGHGSMAAISAAGLVKRYGQFIAVDDLSFEVERGETVGLFGPNGAGKTSVLRMLAGLTRPTEGTITIDGIERTPAKTELRRKIGVVTHESMTYDGLTARENLRFHARLHGIDGAAERCEAVLERVGLARRASRHPDEYSHGLRKRLSLARALLHDPGILLLDEPYSGLDQRASTSLDATLETLRAKTIVLTTHDLEQGYARCDRAIVLARGTRRADFAIDGCSLDEFRSRYRHAIETAPSESPSDPG